MTRTLVGAGGWGYFAGGLGSYARAYGFVEVNATFYRRVSEATARRWRSSVPPNFTFSVKAHRDVTHRGPLRASAAVRAAFAASARTAALLRAPFLVLETPESLAFGTSDGEALRELAAIVPAGTRLGLEARAHSRGPLPTALLKTMQEEGVLDVVDLSRSTPRLEDDAVYTRIFGKGDFNAYEFDDEELREIDHAGREAKTVAYAFHGVRMYKDAARFLTFRRTGEFPPATRSTGLESLAEVLAPDARFPATRKELCQDHGWKLVDLDANRRAHAEVYLTRLPDRRYDDLAAVLRTLRTAAPSPKG